MPDALPGHRKAKKEDHCPALGRKHGRTVRREGGKAVGGFTRRVRYSRRTSATATSPTTCKLAALTLSMVSSGVCQAG